MNIKQMNYLKQERGYSYDQMSELSGVPKGTIQKILNGTTKTPRYETQRALERIFEKSVTTYTYLSDGDSYGVPKENPLIRHTLEDYYALPNERRVELIDGIFYDLAAPTTTHQQIITEYTFQLVSYIKQNKGECQVFPAPTNVRLDDDDYTMVEPDILVVCDKNKITPKYIAGAPDFIIEILSPSSRQKDTTVKIYKYIHAGVREYWVVDPYKRRVTAYTNMTEEVFPTIYNFDDDIPVGIYDGELTLSLKDVV